MEQVLGRMSPYIYAILRIVSGFLFMWHGTQKILKFPVNSPNPCQCPPGPPMSDMMSALIPIAGIIELTCGILILIGLLTGFAAFLASGLMAFAYFLSHSSIQALLPIQNKGELAVIYCFLFLYIASVGAGVWSIDAWLRRNKRSAPDNI